MTARGYTIVETAVALALTSVLAAGVLRGLELVEGAYARWERSVAGGASFGEARSLFLADAWSADECLPAAGGGVRFAVGLDTVSWAQTAPGRVLRVHRRGAGARADSLAGYLRAVEGGVLLLCPRAGGDLGCARVGVAANATGS